MNSEWNDRNGLTEAALDSSAGCTAALAVDGAIVWAGELAPPGRGGEAVTAQRLRAVLNQHGVRVRDVRRWTVGTGPGSFTGLRSGIALVLGICRGSGALCRGVSSAWGLARELLDRDGEIRSLAVLHDARRSEIIVTCFMRGPDDLPALSAPATVCSRDEALHILEQTDAGISPHEERLRPLLDGATPRPVQYVDRVDCRWFLSPPQPPWPESDEERRKSLQPVYVRPAVHVPPRFG